MVNAAIVSVPKRSRKPRTRFAGATTSWLTAPHTKVGARLPTGEPSVTMLGDAASPSTPPTCDYRLRAGEIRAVLSRALRRLERAVAARAVAPDQTGANAGRGIDATGGSARS